MDEPIERAGDEERALPSEGLCLDVVIGVMVCVGFTEEPGTNGVPPSIQAVGGVGDDAGEEGGGGVFTDGDMFSKSGLLGISGVVAKFTWKKV